ncbi:MAG: short chain dehydrogenase [Rhodospirillaceae bacterium]|nr:short chain dehydrogenase [Rhodospirillaceae bacterium]|tara:strand:+ start:592 stop:1344 length:753 start_codon:yes stop_codon:yes gene_type:complete
MTRSVLITGGAQRIGAGLAKALGNAGWHVCVHFNQSEQHAAAIVADIKADGGVANAIHANLEDPAAASQLVEQCIKVMGHLTCLVNNASIFQYDGIEDISAKALDQHHAVNLRAPMLLASCFAEQLPEGKIGNIVNILDSKVFAPNPDYLSYTLSKVALTGATEALAMALAPRIRVNGVAPGITLLSGEQSESRFQKAHTTNPLKQGCTIEQIVASIQLILDCPAMTGEIITIDGGQRLQKLPRDIAFLT